MQFYILLCSVVWHKKNGEPVFQSVGPAMSASSYPFVVVVFQVEFCCDLKILLECEGSYFLEAHGLLLVGTLVIIGPAPFFYTQCDREDSVRTAAQGCWQSPGLCAPRGC